MLWILAAFAVPILAGLILFLSLADDFWQLITFRLDFSRLFGDLFHVFFIILIAILAEGFVLFHVAQTLL